MENTFNLNSKVRDIVTKFPRAMETFKKYNIDFCCGGDRALELAVKENNLDGNKVLEELNEQYKHYVTEAIKDRDWTIEPYDQFIDYIVNKHHGYLNEVLPRLSQLTTKVLRAHGANHPELKEVHKLFHSLKMELEQHLIKEEELVFPFVVEYQTTKDIDILRKAVEQIQALEDEHEGAGTILKELREITNNYELPSDACTSYGITYKLLSEVEDDTFRHIHLENNILFPRLEEELKSLS